MRPMLIGLLALGGWAWAQPFHWPASYAPTVVYGGVIRTAQTIPEGAYSFNPATAEPGSWFALLDAPPLIYRDWLGSRSFRKPDGSFNLFFAREVREVALEREFVVTLRTGWRWSDGTEITADDAIAARIIQGDADVAGNRFYCSEVDGEPISYEKLGRYRYRITLPKARVNALADTCGFLPAHIFMPRYERAGAEGIRALWGEKTPPQDVVSGGPYVLEEIQPGERVVMRRNPLYGEGVRAADGSQLPGPNSWVFLEMQDGTAELAAVVTGQLDLYQPTSLEQVQAVREALERGNVRGKLYTNLGPETWVGFITYNFNSTDPCKRELFRSVAFRQAISLMIDRQALVQAVLGGLGFAAKNWLTEAAAPFHAPHLGPLPFDPPLGVRKLHEIGFRDLDEDGVLIDFQTGCRAEFDLQIVADEALGELQVQVISQTLAPYGVKVNPRAVSYEIWAESITGQGLPRKYDSDAVLWGLSSGDLDNPSFSNGLRIGAELNAWNKSKTDVEPWEIQLDRLTAKIDETLDRGERIALYNERATLMRKYLPLTPLASPAFHYYLNVGNVWPEGAMDAFSLEGNPGNFPGNVMARYSR